MENIFFKMEKLEGNLRFLYIQNYTILSTLKNIYNSNYKIIPKKMIL